MIEVEAKVKISDISYFRKKAKEIGKFAGKKRKVDFYYTLQNDGKYPQKSLRIRKLDKSYIINFKRRISGENKVDVKNETEFKVSDINGFQKLIEDFGFRKWLIKEKETELYKIKNNFNIELNKVKGLGYFVEIEYLANPDDVSKAKKEVSSVLKKLGIDEKNVVKEGYTKLLWDKMN